MATVARNTIAVVATGLRKYEKVAVAAITPGHLIELTSADEVQVHSTAGGSAERLFALEDSLQGNTITDAYAADDRVTYGAFNAGDQVYCLLANGENASIGSKLESNGNGELRVVDTDASVGEIGVASIVATALEAVDMSGSSGVDPNGRILVQIW
jgi:hypothetical protein